MNLIPERSVSLDVCNRSARIMALVCTMLVTLAAAGHARSQSENAPTIILVVRHAEKALAAGTDPPLSDAGRKRAEQLARAAEDAGVTAIYTTQFKRTLETAQPVAARTGAPVRSVEINKENTSGYAVALAKRVLAENAGQTVMVIGHSNTVPLLVEAFGGERPPAIDDATEFDRFFVVIVPKPGKIKTIKARY